MEQANKISKYLKYLKTAMNKLELRNIKTLHTTSKYIFYNFI